MDNDDSVKTQVAPSQPPPGPARQPLIKSSLAIITITAPALIGLLYVGYQFGYQQAADSQRIASEHTLLDQKTDELRKAQEAFEKQQLLTVEANDLRSKLLATEADASLANRENEALSIKVADLQSGIVDVNEALQDARYMFAGTLNQLVNVENLDDLREIMQILSIDYQVTAEMLDGTDVLSGDYEFSIDDYKVIVLRRLSELPEPVSESAKEIRDELIREIRLATPDSIKRVAAAASSRGRSPDQND